MIKDKFIQIAVAPDNSVYALTESGQIYKKAMATGANWVKVKAPKIFKQNA
jgi:hypothetical protein